LIFPNGQWFLPHPKCSNAADTAAPGRQASRWSGVIERLQVARLIETAAEAVAAS
jgi:hypothetical protein